MPLLGLTTAFLAAVVADLKGDAQTRPFTRWGFGVVCIYHLDLVALAAGATADVVGALGGMIG